TLHTLAFPTLHTRRLLLLTGSSPSLFLTNSLLLTSPLSLSYQAHRPGKGATHVHAYYRPPIFPRSDEHRGDSPMSKVQI
uniref:Uncharacterized protein n=1 Tax=Aegilops tauschii subsp. strangulata TaxID=200361 RepID=A0A453N6S7_AEGTS